MKSNVSFFKFISCQLLMYWIQWTIKATPSVHILTIMFWSLNFSNSCATVSVDVLALCCFKITKSH